MNPACTSPPAAGESEDLPGSRRRRCPRDGLSATVTSRDSIQLGSAAASPSLIGKKARNEFRNGRGDRPLPRIFASLHGAVLSGCISHLVPGGLSRSIFASDPFRYGWSRRDWPKRRCLGYRPSTTRAWLSTQQLMTASLEDLPERAMGPSSMRKVGC